MDISPLLAFSSAILTAVITAFATILVARSKTKVEIGASITSGFRDLTDQLQDERNQLSDIIRRQRDEITAVEKSANDCERTIRRMRRHIAMLETKMERAGIEVPTPREPWE